MQMNVGKQSMWLILLLLLLLLLFLLELLELLAFDDDGFATTEEMAEETVCRGVVNHRCYWWYAVDPLFCVGKERGKSSNGKNQGEEKNKRKEGRNKEKKESREYIILKDLRWVLLNVAGVQIKRVD